MTKASGRAGVPRVIAALGQRVMLVGGGKMREGIDFEITGFSHSGVFEPPRRIVLTLSVADGPGEERVSPSCAIPRPSECRYRAERERIGVPHVCAFECEVCGSLMCWCDNDPDWDRRCSRCMDESIEEDERRAQEESE